ncbi:hypothetical protein DFH06DRAFT_1466471 [Mycena polygramma]|nr:hypothetical protein DFH06DRAFT_1466471 [Mycena polygramma]
MSLRSSALPALAVASLASLSRCVPTPIVLRIRHRPPCYSHRLIASLTSRSLHHALAVDRLAAITPPSPRVRTGVRTPWRWEIQDTLRARSPPSASCATTPQTRRSVGDRARFVCAMWVQNPRRGHAPSVFMLLAVCSVSRLSVGRDAFILCTMSRRFMQ